MEHFLIIEKRNDRGLVSQCSPIINEEIKRHASRHKSHSTWAYNLDNNVFAITHAIFESEKKYKSKSNAAVTGRALQDTARETRNHSLLAMLSEGVSSLGTGPLSDSCKAMYHIIHPSQLYLRDQQGVGRNHRLKGEFLLTLGDKKLKYEEKASPLAATISDVNGFVFKTDRIKETKSRLPTLFLKFKKPNMFQQETSGCIVRSQMNVTDFLDIQIQLREADEFTDSPCPHRGLCMLKKPPKDLRKYSLTLFIRSLTIELLQVTECMSCKEGEVSFADSTKDVKSTTILDKALLKRVDYKVMIDSHGLNIPRVNFNCALPKLGPTFCSNGITRRYVLSVSLGVQFLRTGEQLYELKSHIEICVAKESYLEFRKHSVKYRPDVWCGSYHASSALLFENISGVGACSKLPEELKKVSGWNERLYRGHQSQFFSTSEGTFIVSKVDVFKPKVVERKELMLPLEKKLIADSLTYWPIPEVNTILCQVLMAPYFSADTEVIPGKLYGGLFLKMGGHSFHYDLPLSDPLHTFMPHVDPTYCHELSMFEMDEKYYMSGDLTLRATIKPHNHFRHLGNRIVVTPGMKLSNFLNLSFMLLPGNLVPFRYTYRINALMYVDELKIDLIETVLENNAGSFRYRSHEIPLLVRGWRPVGNWVTQNIYTKFPVLQNFQIPEVGPTFLSGNIFRGYEIRAILKVRHYNSVTSMEVTIGIDIATDTNNCLNKSFDVPVLNEKRRIKLSSIFSKWGFKRPI